MALPPLSPSPSTPCLLNSSQLRLVGARARLFPPFSKERKEGRKEQRSVRVRYRTRGEEEGRGEARRGMRVKRMFTLPARIIFRGNEERR